MAFKALFKFIKRAFGLKKRRSRKKGNGNRRKIRRIRRPAIKKARFKHAKPRKKYLKTAKPARSRKSPPAKKAAKSAKFSKSAKQSRSAQAEMIGLVTHYFPKVRAAVLKLKKPLCVGEPIWIKGKKTDFRQTVASMQIEKKPIERAGSGSEIGLEVFSEVSAGDVVYRMKG